MSVSNKKAIIGGLYLVIDPSIQLDILLKKLTAAIKGGIDIVQIWNNWLPESNKLLFIEEVSNLCKPHQIPIIINEEWELLAKTNHLDGVHFDKIPADISAIKKLIARPILMGITCSGDLEIVSWAAENQFSYISFCSMFPSTSAGHCDIVMPETVRLASEITTIPLFISGGITPENATALKQQIPFDGIAVISGLLSAEDPERQALIYRKALNI